MPKASSGTYNYNTGGPSGGTDFLIGTPGSTSANARRLMQQLAQPSRDWGSAIAKLGAAWALSHNRKKVSEAQRSQSNEKHTRRAGWVSELSAGATPAAIAMRDGHFIGDTEFRKWWDSHQRQEPEFTDVTDDEGNVLGQRGADGRFYDDPRVRAPTETFEDVNSPWGRGGVAQRSSISGKLINYLGPQAPQAPTPASTKKDAQGYLRYFGGDQHGQRVYPEAQIPEDEPTLSPTVATYEQLLDRGHLAPGTTFGEYKEMGRQGTTFNMPAPAPQPGYQNIYDEAGRLTSQQLIPGSKAARDVAAEEAQVEAKAHGAAQRGGIVSAHADAIRKMVGDSGWTTTGLGGSILQDLPGSTAHDVQQRLATLNPHFPSSVDIQCGEKAILL